MLLSIALILVASFCVSSAATAADPLRIACVGDSITEGTVLADPASESWPAVMQRALGKTAVVGNFGRGGATCVLTGDTPYTGSAQAAAALAFDPDLVVIMLGTNDARSANAGVRQAFAADLTSLGNRFAALPSMPLVVLCTPLPAFRANHTVDPDVIATLLAPAVRHVAAEQEWGLIDVHRTMAKLGPGCADGIHPDAAGTQVMGDGILNALKHLKLLRRDLPKPSRLASALSAGKPQHLVTYGTSLTASGAWVGQLQEAIQARHPGLLTITNSGQGSMWSGWGVEHLDERVIAKKPDAVLIEFGINDAYLDYAMTPELAQRNLATMVDRIRKAQPACEIVLMTMNQPTGDHAAKRPRFADFMAMYRTFAKTRRLQLIDLLPRWQRLYASDPARWNQIVPDGIHPDAAGSAMITTPGILQALFQRRVTP